MNTEEKAILMPFYFISLLVALIGNVLIILVFYKYKPIRKSINYFVLNMAISDLFSPLTIMPYVIAKTLSDAAFLKQIPSPLAGVVCKLCYFLADTSIFVSIMSLLMISLDRLIAVVFPLQIRLISKKVRFIGIFMSWVVAISVIGFYFRRMIYFQGHCYLNWDAESFRDYWVAISIAFYFIPRKLPNRAQVRVLGRIQIWKPQPFCKQKTDLIQETNQKFKLRSSQYKSR
ncbi:orexin receptor type 2-like [Acropora millepora]|uniref:orexin receptor type 2-like n=1 Tax=Acropora millepora TaxID=45264 RepID=UPI001CF399C7|nr:orexin receptor type 2-like [Acropora millepora]